MTEERRLSMMIAILGTMAFMASALINISVIFGQALPTGVITAPPPARFVYDVRVQEEGLLNPIANSPVIIDVPGEEPLVATTDSKGLSLMIVGSALVGKTGQLFVEAEGYDIYVQEVEVMDGELPDVVRLDAQP